MYQVFRILLLYTKFLYLRRKCYLSTFLRGSILLMISIFLSKFLGFIYRMQFVRLTGEEAVGIYMTAYPAFIFFLSLIQLGIPIAMAKIIAELRTRNAISDYFSVMRTSVIVTVISILNFHTFIYFCHTIYFR